MESLQWIGDVKTTLGRSISDKSISRAELIDGLQQISDYCEDWLDTLRDEESRGK